MYSTRIRELRDNLDLSQTEFGRRLGVSRSVINNLERSVTDPSPVFVDHMCDVYHCKKHWLETGEGEMFEPADPHSDAQRIAETISASPAAQSLLAAWEQLDDNGRAVFEDYVRAFVADYRQREADRTTAAYQRILDEPEPLAEDSPSDAI